MRSATRVEAFRISAGHETNDFVTLPPSSGPVAVDADLAKQLAEILLDPKSFSDNPKPCEPSPGIRVVWWKGSLEVHTVFCFECSELWFYSQEKRRDQREFDPVEQRLAAIMKKIFPKDHDIQQLK